MAIDDEATAGAVNDTASAGTASWYHVYVPFKSGTVSAPDGGADVPATSGTHYYLPDPSTAVSMGSFLHIGAANSDLLTSAKITSAFTDAAAQATFTRALNLTSFAAGFLDDNRVRGPNASSVAQRQAESANLYTKGGWRDHTDGNRITTTAGDKVEVIGGNHVMMILGRPTRDNALDNTNFSAGPNGLPMQHQIETSGGLSYSNDAGPGHIEEVRWVTRAYPAGANPNSPGDGGTWMVREKSQFGDQVSISAGLTHESFVGVGVEINSGTAYGYHGSIEDLESILQSALMYPELDTTAFLTQVYRDENTEANAPYFADMSTPETLIASIKNNRDKVYGGSYPVPAQKTVEFTRLDSTYANAIVGTVEEYTTINTSKHEETTINVTNFEQTTVNGNTSEVSLIAGAKEETDLMIGPVEAISMYMGLKEEISLNASNALTIEIGIGKEDITIVPFILELNLDGEKLEYTLDKTGIHLNVNEITLMKDKVTTLTTELHGAHIDNSGVIVLG